MFFLFLILVGLLGGEEVDGKSFLLRISVAGRFVAGPDECPVVAAPRLRLAEGDSIMVVLLFILKNLSYYLLI